MSLLPTGEARINRLEKAGACPRNFDDQSPQNTINRKWHHYAMFGNINSAEMAYEMGFQRSYFHTGGASLLKSAALSLIALPGLILRTIVAALSIIFRIPESGYGTQHGWGAMDPFFDRGKETCQAVYMLLSGTLLGLSKLALSMFADPVLWIKHEIQANNPETNKNAAIVIIDAQEDFVKRDEDGIKADADRRGGRLGVPDGDKIVLPIAALRTAFVKDRNVVALSLDWHPIDHCSFAANAGLNQDQNALKMGEHIEVDGLDQTLWPVHCVQNSKGAKLIGIDPKVDFVVRKGLDRFTDSYSAVSDNGGRNETILHERLQYANVKRVYLVGIATDVCVAATARGLAARGYAVTIVEDGCKGVTPENHAQAIAAVRNIPGIRVANSDDLIGNHKDFTHPAPPAAAPIKTPAADATEK